MRFLFVFVGGVGHFLPTLPFARALHARGHHVVYGCQQAMLHTVAATGIAAYPCGGATLLDPKERRQLAALDQQKEDRVLREVFAGSIARERSAGIRGLAGRWVPDVIVRDEIDFGAAVAADSLGIPQVTVVVTAAGGFVRPELLTDRLMELRRECGLSIRPGAGWPNGQLTLVPVPRSFRDPGSLLPLTARYVLPGVLDPHGEDSISPHPAPVRADRPMVYVTLGTIFHQESGDLLPRIVAGLRTLDADVVVTVGREIDPSELGPQPANIQVHRYLPQQTVMPACDLTVSHGGSGTVIGALAYGVPCLLLPMGADQAHNAARCVDLGVGIALQADASASTIGAAAAEILGSHRYRRSAQGIRQEALALPDSNWAAELLERV